MPQPLAELHLEDSQVVHLQALATQVELQLAQGYPKCMNDILKQYLFIYFEKRNQARVQNNMMQDSNHYKKGRSSKLIKMLATKIYSRYVSLRNLTTIIYIRYTDIQQLFQGC